MLLLQLSVIMLVISLVLLIPVTIGISQTVDDEPNSLNVPDIVPTNDTIGPLATVNELYKAHDIVTQRMIDNSESIKNTGYGDEEVYLEASYVDEEKQTLVVWLEPIHAFDPIDIDDLQEELGLGIIPIEVIYGYYVSDALASQATSCPASVTSLVCYYWERYVQQCLPTKTNTSCDIYERIITGPGYSLPTLLNSRPVDTDGDGINDNVDQCPTRAETRNNYQDTDGCPDTPPSSSTSQTGVIFQDNFESGIGKWVESGQLEWQSGTLDESAVIPGYTTSNKVAEADDCDDQACILSMRTSIDLSRYSSAKLEFDRFVDNSLDSGEYLAVQVGNNGRYTQVLKWTHGSGDDDRWHHETVDLGRYLAAGFNVRFVTEQSSNVEDVAIDNVKITASSSTTQCTLRVTAALQNDGSIRVSWNSCSGIKQYKVYTSENGGSNIYKGSTSGTTFTISNPTEGKNYVISVKAQKSDNTYTNYFKSNVITVPTVDRTPPVIITPSPTSFITTNSSGGVVNYFVIAKDTNDGIVKASCNPPPGTKFPIGNTVVTCRATDESGNTATARFTINLTYSATCSSDSIAESGLQCIIDDIITDITTSLLGPYIYGGQPIGMYYQYFNSSSRVTDEDYNEGTATIGAELKNGTKVLIISGHMLDPKMPNFIPGTNALVANFQNKTEVITDVGLGRVNFHPSKSLPADAAYVILKDRFNAKDDQVITKNGTKVKIIEKGGLYDYGRYPYVHILGMVTNSEGSVNYVNATVRYFHTILTNQALSLYSSVQGDSGAPIIYYHQNGTASLFGLHVGKLCTFSSDGTTPPPISSTTDCPYLQYKINVFSPWENVRSGLGLK